MPASLTASQDWKVIEKELFAVLGMVTAKGEARTTGVVYVVRDRKLYIVTEKDMWKARHIDANPHVSLTVTIEKRIPFMPWYKVPPATISFSGTARILCPDDAPPDILSTVLRGMVVDPQALARTCIIEVTPEKDFITYGVGVSLMDMRDPDKATGRVPVD